MRYNFDQVISRLGTNSAKWDGTASSLGNDMIVLSVADMDLQAPPQVVNKVSEMAHHGIYGYTDPFPPYYKAVQQWLEKAYGWNVPEDWIVFCPRIVQAVSIVIQRFTEPRDRILIHTPAYQPIASAVEINGRTLVENQLLLKDGHYEIDFDAMERQMQAGVRMVLLISPHNPTGRVWKKIELERIADLCIRYDVLLVSDDIHADFIHEGHEHTIVAALSEQIAERSIICTSPGKTFNLASLEIANIVIPNKQLRDEFQLGLRQAGIHNPTFFAVPALEVAYTECDQWLAELQAYIRENISFTEHFFAEHMPELKIVRSEGTYLLWIDCSAISRNESVLIDWIQNKSRVSVSFGTSFGADGEGFIRLNLGAPRALLQEAFERMASNYPLSNR